MDEPTKIMVGIGSAAAANCGPCFDQYYAKALELGIGEEDVRMAVEIGSQMKTGGNLAMLKRIQEIMADTDQGDVSGAGEADRGSNPESPSCCG